MKVVIDMNLGAAWVECLKSAGHEARHWSDIGSADADDDAIMMWARANDHVVLTADLDFGGRLVRSGDDGPSVVQLRTENTLTSVVGDLVTRALARADAALRAGALVTIETERFRVRPLSDTPTIPGLLPWSN